MSRNIRPFSNDCEHVLQALPMFNMTLYACGKCGGVQDITPEALAGADYETVTAALIAEVGGTIGEPVELPPSSFDADDAIANRLADADIAFIEYLDAWIDKGIADGTLTIAKAAEYREAIAARCAELGEVPHVREHIAALKLKPGDVLALIAPRDSTILMQQLARETTRYLDYWNIKDVAVVVYPPGTEIRVLDRQPEEAASEVDVQPEPEKAPLNINIQFHGGPTDGDASAAITARVRAVMAAEARRNALYGRGLL